MNDNYFRTVKTLHGKHASYVKLLREKGIFERYIDVYKLAPLIGFLYSTKRDLDKNKNKNSNNDTYEASIFTDQMVKEAEYIKISFRLIILLDTKHELSEERRIDKAFRELADSQDDINIFESYIRGGIEIIYDKIIGTSEYKEQMDDFMENTKKFLDEVVARYKEIYDLEVNH